MRAWDTYTGVESTVKNMITSLKAVGELQNPAIRERHWDQLMAATGVSHKEGESNREYMYMYYILKAKESFKKITYDVDGRVTFCIRLS